MEPPTIIRPAWWRGCLALTLIVLLLPTIARGQGAIDGYGDYRTFAERLKAIDAAPHADVRSLGQTLRGARSI